MEIHGVNENEWWVIRLDETHHCNKKWLTERKISKFWGLYLFQPGIIYHHCSAQKDYTLFTIPEPYFETSEELSEEENEKLEEEIRNILCDSDKISIYSCNDINQKADLDKRKLGVFDSFDDALEKYQSNPIW